MNRKQLIFLLVAMAVIGGAGLVLLNQHQESWAVHEAKMGDKVLPNFQPNDVAAIHIKGGSDLNVVHKNDLWHVQERGDYPANFGQISDLLIKLRDLKVVEAESIGPSDLARVNLDEPGKGSDSGTLVEFKDGQGKVLAALLLGKQHMRQQSESRSHFVGDSPDGRYLLLPNNPGDVLLVSNALNSLQPSPQQWLSRDFFKVEKMKSIALASTNAANSWKIARETDSSPWVLIDGKPGEVLDASKAALTANALAYPSFVDVIVPSPPSAQTGLDNPMVVTFETFDHFTYTLRIGAKPAEQSYYMTVAVTANIPTERVAVADEKPEDRQKLDMEFQDKTRKLQSKLKQEQALASWVYVVNSWILDPLILDRSQLLGRNKEKKVADAGETETPSAVTKVAPNPGEPSWTPRVIK